VLRESLHQFDSCNQIACLLHDEIHITIELTDSHNAVEVANIGVVENKMT
jgi:hypothetical protein